MYPFADNHVYLFRGHLKNPFGQVLGSVHHEGHEVHEEVIKHLYLINLFILRVLRG